ncbi:NAD(+) diphosphatase [Escherichia coli]
MDCIIEKLDHGWWVVSHEQKLWLPKGELPYGEAANFDLVGQRALQIGEWQGEPVWLVQQQRRHDMGRYVRSLISMLGCFNWPDEAYNWRSFTDRINTVVTAGMKCIRAKPNGRCCAAIAVSVTTRKSPRIIVAIRRDDSILLAQHTRHRNGVHTVLAGFVEVGETLEQAVAREVMEESGIKVKNLRYVTSQPWPFSSVFNDRVYGGI